MALRSALAGSATTAGLIALLGNPAVVDELGADDPSPLAGTLVNFASWDVLSADGEVVGLAALRVAVVLVVVGLLCALAGGSRARGASFLAGWAALVVAAGVAAAAHYAYFVAVILDGNSVAPSYADGLVAAVNGGAAFGLWTGWAVGAALAVVTRTTPAPAPAVARPAGVGTPAHGERVFAEPPPPWWAPTRVDDRGTVVQAGPSVFPPGGLPHPPAGSPVRPAPAPPVLAGGSGNREATTASGDPHPSDPDATQPVGLPPREGGEDDPDATTTMDATGEDRTIPIPRQRD